MNKEYVNPKMAVENIELRIFESGIDYLNYFVGKLMIARQDAHLGQAHLSTHLARMARTNFQYYSSNA